MPPEAITYTLLVGKIGRVEGFLTIGDARRVTRLLLQEEPPFRHNEITIPVKAVTGGVQLDLGPNSIEDVRPAVG